MSENEKTKAPKKSGMNQRLKTWIDHLIGIVFETLRVFKRHDMSVFSGYTALYMLMALVPFVALAAGLINFLPEELLESILELFMSVIPDIPEIRSFVSGLLTQVSPESGAVVVSVSLISMLWSASKGVSALQLGLMRISENDQSPVIRKVSSLFYTVLFVLLIPSLLIFQVLRSVLLDLGNYLAELFSMPKIAELFSLILENGYLVSAAALAFVMVLVYTQLQGRAHRLRHQLPGAIFTTVLWMLASLIFELFVTKMWGASSLYGPLASVYLITWWMKIIITIFFYGASLNEAIYLYRHSKIDQPMDASGLKELIRNYLPDKTGQKKNG